MVALDDGGEPGPRRPALERHPLGRRRRATSSPRWAGRRPAPTRSAACWSRRSPPPSCGGCATTSPSTPPRVATVLLPHDYVSRHLAAPGTEPFTDRGDASGTGYFATARRPVATRPARAGARPRRARCRASSRPAQVAGRDPRRRGPRRRHRRQHGRRARHGARPGRRPRLGRHLGRRLGREHRRRSPTAPASSPASPTRAAASCRWSPR